MGRSQRLRFNEIREVFHLIGELCELGQNVEIWRRHMLQRLNRFIGARASYSFQTRLPLINDLATITGYVEEGIDDSSVMFKYFFEDGYKRDVCIPRLNAIHMKGEHFTVARRDLVDDQTWYAADATQAYCSALGTDDFMSSQYQFRPIIPTQAINLHRDRGDKRPFELHDKRLVQLFHTELGRLWENKEFPKPDPCEGLSPRMRQIVTFLRGGFSEKEIAAKTKLSPHTIHDYVKRLHTHFGVSNRAGLLVATNPPPASYRPVLAP